MYCRFPKKNKQNLAWTARSLFTFLPPNAVHLLSYPKYECPLFIFLTYITIVEKVKFCCFKHAWIVRHVSNLLRYPIPKKVKKNGRDNFFLHKNYFSEGNSTVVKHFTPVMYPWSGIFTRQVVLPIRLSRRQGFSAFSVLCIHFLVSQYTRYHIYFLT